MISLVILFRWVLITWEQVPNSLFPAILPFQLLLHQQVCKFGVCFCWNFGTSEQIGFAWCAFCQHYLSWRKGDRLPPAISIGQEGLGLLVNQSKVCISMPPRLKLLFILVQVKKVVGFTAPPEFVEEVRNLAVGHSRLLSVDCIRAYHFGVSPNFLTPGCPKILIWVHIALHQAGKQCSFLSSAIFHS